MSKLLIYPDVFVWCKGDMVLLYNARTGVKLQHKVTEQIKAIYEQINNLDNLYTAVLELHNLDEDSKQFVSNIEAMSLGKLMNDNSSSISIPPLLKIHNERYVNKSESRTNILNYLSSITIHIGGYNINNEYYKQTIYPASSERTINYEHVKSFLAPLHSNNIETINVVLPNKCDSKLMHFLDSIKGACKNLELFYLPLSEEVSHILPLFKKYKTHIICETIDRSHSYSLIYEIHSSGIDLSSLRFHFITKSADDYNYWLKEVCSNSITNYTICPIYDNNLDFFSNYIFLSEQDILGLQPSKREIYIHQTLNIYNFGKLTITPDGEVYSGLYSSLLGTTDEHIRDIIFKELASEKSWFYTRNYETCKKCVFQWLCPSPSVYEEATGHIGCLINNNTK